MQGRQNNIPGAIAALWALAGFSLLMSQAVRKLLAVSLDAANYDFSALQWLLLAAFIIFMAYSEGYKGFQKGFSPRFANRTMHLYHQGSSIERLLAPLYCMNFFNAPVRRMLVSYSLLLLILTFIFLFQHIPQPWRGILDAGVVVGLLWGLASTIYYFFRAFFKKPVIQSGEGNTTT
ncbi:MAG: hypothetical protein EX270_01005 [Pseudomonadales bacterium]|nr:hypothetical protein [Pseudomonadales bacterium]RZV59995.1 MAG: hypothetical protein EX270_01005 [Pseudomonadales bacterium]